VGACEAGARGSDASYACTVERITVRACLQERNATAGVASAPVSSSAMATGTAPWDRPALGMPPGARTRHGDKAIGRALGVDDKTAPIGPSVRKSAHKTMVLISTPAQSSPPDPCSIHSASGDLAWTPVSDQEVRSLRRVDRAGQRQNGGATSRSPALEAGMAWGPAPRPIRCGGRFEFSAKVETAGIEPASAVA
jgi:hypothetical protein